MMIQQPLYETDTDDEDYVENVAQLENIPTSDAEITELLCPTSPPEVKFGLERIALFSFVETGGGEIPK
ncbi:hypothetical protein TNCV_695621 [Trichonephila clavipes]|nr:hypothetical protein TNCV_695621 [Trichonephila clavipes]